MNADPIPDSIIMDIEEYLRLATKKAAAMRAELADLRRRLRKAEAAAGVHVWTPCSVRMPTKEDADCEGRVWWGFWDGPWVVFRLDWNIIPGSDGAFTHWTPTGLRRPEPPQPE